MYTLSATSSMLYDSTRNLVPEKSYDTRMMHVANYSFFFLVNEWKDNIHYSIHFVCRLLH